MELKLSEEEKRDALEQLYLSSFSGYFISFVASSLIVITFFEHELASVKTTWWAVFNCIIALRLYDSLYWKKSLQNTQFNASRVFKRFYLSCSTTAVLWVVYVLLILPVGNIPELAFVFVVIAGMAGGSATVLAGSKYVSVTYSSILLFPVSIYMTTFEERFCSNIGYAGIFFGFVMVLSGLRSASLTLNAIRVQHKNRSLVDDMNREQKEIKRINHQLGEAYDRINEANSSLEIEVEKRTEEIHLLSNLDPLTKLYNRNAFITALQDLLDPDDALESVVVVLFIDLDGFKQINDALGHDIGDEVLKEITSRILALRLDGCVGRWGGDEFVLALPNKGQEDALDHARRIMDEIALPIRVDSLTLNLGASIGIALSPEQSVSAHKLIQFADIAMYKHKHSEDKFARVFSPAFLAELQEKERLREGLRQALKANDFIVYYQPIIDCNAKKVVSCEALVRWCYEGKILKPDVFMYIAEQSRLIVELGRYVLVQACHDAVVWNKETCCKVSVNVSVVQLFDDSFVSYLDEALSQSGLLPELLTLEITESTFASNQQYLRGLLEQIKKRGVELSIDDFGVGYSSMSQLQTLPFDIIKVDRSFVDEIDESGEAIIKATLFIAKALGCKAVAEGVETLEQLERLESLGADYLQGFLFSRAIPQSEIIKYISTFDTAKVMGAALN